jgi:AcrR family transcriptional regulator
MKTNKKEILQAAAYLFMSNGYNGTSIAQISAAVGIQKASLFSHIKSKEELYRKVVETYVINKHNPDLKFDKNNGSLADFIESYIDGIKKSMEILYALDLGFGDLKPVSYFGFILEACKRYDDCARTFLAVDQKEVILWEEVIQKAKDKGEVRADVDVKWASRMFRYNFAGLSYIFSTQGGVTLEQIKEMLYDSYNAIKV